jgi:hypothetical protein
MKTIKLLILLLPIIILLSCEEEGFEKGQVTGLWKQVSVTEDGTEMELTPEQEACQLLIEANGMLRYYHRSFERFNNGNGPTTFFGTWSVLEGTWINFTTDKWQFVPTLSSDSAKVSLSYKDNNDIDTITSVKKQWNKYHIQSRFTILQLTDNTLQVRIKTFEGEKKYALLFAPEPDDFIELGTTSGEVSYCPKLVTDDNYWTIRKEYQTLKTYVFTFEREDY